MTTFKTLDVPGAQLRYSLRGSGPLLVLIAGGADGVAGSAGLADELADAYTVLTYDRRGLGESTLAVSASAPTITTHADDVHYLLAELTDEPAHAYGTSIGGVIALELVTRHPEQVRLLVAHEPAASHLLPEPARTRAQNEQKGIEEAYRTEGVMQALFKFAVMAGINPQEAEAGVSFNLPGPEAMPSMQFFLENDAPAVRRHELDLAALQKASTRIVPGVGQTSQKIFAHAVGVRLSEVLGVPYAEFPGGHNAGVFQPRAFGARLREALQSETP